MAEVIHDLNAYAVAADAQFETLKGLKEDMMNRQSQATNLPQSSKSYAQALGTQPGGQTCPPIPISRKGPKKSTETVLLFPEAKDVTSSEQAKVAIVTKINPANANLRIHRMSGIRDKGVAVEVDD